MSRFTLFIVILFSSIMFSQCDKPGDSGEGNNNVVVPKISIEGVDALEGNESNSQFEFDVTLSASTTTTVTVDFATQDASAKAGEDYLARSGTLTFEPGDIKETITIEVIGDSEDEEKEQFLVKLSNAVNGTLSVSDAIGGIANDEDIIVNPGDGYSTPLEYEGYELTWHDEFNEPTINPNFYTHELGDNGWGNQELQNYTSSPQNSYIKDGMLCIEAKDEGNNTYTSARIVTKDKFEFVFGRVDIRAKVPGTQGIWPALWMLGENISDIGWPACGEIDIMELVGHEQSTIHGTAHYGAQGQGYSIFKGNHSTLDGGQHYDDEFHVFSIVWESNSIKWYRDDILFHSLIPSDIGNEVWRFNQEFFFIFNVAVGGQWPGYPDATTVFPAKMEIDYIRVFQ